MPFASDAQRKAVMALLQQQEQGRYAKRTLKKRFTRKQRRAGMEERALQQNWQFWTGQEKLAHMKKVRGERIRFGQRMGMYREATPDEREWLKKKFRKRRYRKEPGKLRAKWEKKKGKRKQYGLEFDQPHMMQGMYQHKEGKRKARLSTGQYL